MFKVLLHKNFLELGSYYFRSKKTGGKLKGGAFVGMVVLYVCLFLLLAGSFAAMASLFFISAEPGQEWIAFSIMGLIAVLMSVIINSLTSYAQLYLAKDNEFLLSMPIKTGSIIASRMVSVYFMGVLYAGMVWLPTLIIGVVMHKVGALGIVCSILTMLLIGFGVLALTCLIGWVIAYLSSKLKNQKALAAIVGLVMIGGIYYFQYKSNKLFTYIAEHMEQAGNTIIHKLFPFYLMGKSATGSVVGLLGTIAIVAVLMAFAYILMSKTFLKVATTKAVGKAAKYNEKNIHLKSVDAALLTKERRRFFGSITYMLNTGLGAIIMIILGVLAMAKGETLYAQYEPLMEALPEIKQLLPLVAVLVIMMVEALTEVTPFAISLEGKNLWMLQSMPVDYVKVLRSKLQFSTCLQGIPALFLAIGIQSAINFDTAVYAGIILITVAYSYFSSCFGLMMNLKHPRLDWTTESQCIKQGLPITLTMFGGWGVAMVVGVLGYFTRNIISVGIYLLVVGAIFFALYLYLSNWLKTKGVEIFRYL